MWDHKGRDSPSQEQESRDVNGFERALETLQEQLERERSRADALSAECTS